ncbi:MAG TPA: hypothetical protein VFQ35_19110 [Polyangiaceae bacterium]|nr:hypothetical protein [Polyangiaceae bacterium]
MTAASVRWAVLALSLPLAVGCAASTPSATAASPATNPASAAPGQAPGKSEPGASADCRPWATVVEGPYRYTNNVWGKDKAKGPFEQCLLSRTVEGRVERGWTWSWPGFDPSVFSYPEIEFGWKPWNGGKSTDARFPMRVSDATQFRLNYEIETSVSGNFDFAPEVWLLKERPSTESANPKLITTEIMFWLDYGGGARPAGRAIQKFALDGADYELWKEDDIGKEANGQGWRLYSFKSLTVQRKGVLRIDAFLKHLVEQNLVNPDEFVAGVEFGNEVMGGTGTTWVKRFEVEVGNSG